MNYERKIRFSDTDAQAVVFNANYIVYWDDANTDLFEAIGIPWAEFNARGADMMLANTTINHHESAKLGDTLLTASSIVGFGRSSVKYSLLTTNKATGATVAAGTQTQVVLDLATGKPMDIPSWFRDAVEAFQGGRVPQLSKRYLRPPVSTKDQSWDDFVVGEWEEFGSYTVTAEEIVDFASKYDPQVFHLDSEAAKDTMFGELVASGWHTSSLMMRMIVEHHVDHHHGMGSPGMDEIRWKVPVFPGDTLRVRSQATEKRPSRSKPDRGVVFIDSEVLNQNGVVVMTAKSRVIYMKRGHGRAVSES